MTMASRKLLPSQAELQEVFSYDPATGYLLRRGKRAGCRRPNGYRAVRFPGRGVFLEHRLIWKLVKNSDPDTIDHLNGVRDDNRIENLRAVSQQENADRANQIHKASDLPRGVFRQSNGTYTLRRKIDGKWKSVGTFSRLEDLKATYLDGQ